MATVVKGKSSAPANEPQAPKKSCVRKTIGYLLMLLVVAIGVLCGVIISRPNEMTVTRSATFHATPAAVFEQVNDFHKWDAWSPWAKMDPNAKSTFEGPTSGKDAKMSWAGNSDVGEGSMTIVDSQPNDHVFIKLDFIKPFEGSNDVVMKIEPQGENTKLTWTMSGKTNFITKAMGLVMDCDKMVGDQFEKGLANMKAIVEAKPAAEAANPNKT